MKEYRLQDWLPTTRKEMDLRGWDYVDVILFSGDAYVDHPSFGAAVIGRTLEAEGLRVAIVPQPNWQDDLRDFKKLGIPRLFFGISAGAMDSMVNHYTANQEIEERRCLYSQWPAWHETRLSYNRLQPYLKTVIPGYSDYRGGNRSLYATPDSLRLLARQTIARHSG